MSNQIEYPDIEGGLLEAFINLPASKRCNRTWNSEVTVHLIWLEPYKVCAKVTIEPNEVHSDWAVYDGIDGLMHLENAIAAAWEEYTRGRSLPV